MNSLDIFTRLVIAFSVILKKKRCTKPERFIKRIQFIVIGLLIYALE